MRFVGFNLTARVTFVVLLYYSEGMALVCMCVCVNCMLGFECVGVCYMKYIPLNQTRAAAHWLLVRSFILLPQGHTYADYVLGHSHIYAKFILCSSHFKPFILWIICLNVARYTRRNTSICCNQHWKDRIWVDSAMPLNSWSGVLLTPQASICCYYWKNGFC